jgi:ribulose-phosphate 3-epimerase
MAGLDLVILMSVNPGSGGQKFIKSTYDKLQRLVDLKQRTGSQALIEIDGGVGPHNAGKLVALGANALVAGNAVFGANDPLNVIKTLKQKPTDTIEI